MEGGDGGIYRVVWESLQWQEPNEAEFGFLIHNAVRAWVPLWPLLHSGTDPSAHGNQRRGRREEAEGQLQITCSSNRANLSHKHSSHFHSSRCTKGVMALTLFIPIGRAWAQLLGCFFHRMWVTHTVTDSDEAVLLDLIGKSKVMQPVCHILTLICIKVKCLKRLVRMDTVRGRVSLLFWWVLNYFISWPNLILPFI